MQSFETGDAPIFGDVERYVDRFYELSEENLHVPRSGEQYEARAKIFNLCSKYNLDVNSVVQAIHAEVAYRDDATYTRIIGNFSNNIVAASQMHYTEEQVEAFRKELDDTIDFLA